MNHTMVITAYASMYRELGLKLDFPGAEENYKAVYQITDSSLLAKGRVDVEEFILCKRAIQHHKW